MGEQEDRQETLIFRLRRDAEVREQDLAALRERLEAVEHELEDLRAIRDALTPPELPRRPGLALGAAFLPAAAERELPRARICVRDGHDQLEGQWVKRSRRLRRVTRDGSP